MKRSAMKRGQSLLRRSPLKTTSAKTRRNAPKRAKLRQQMLADSPLCERCAQAPATDLHERKRRSQGGDPLRAEEISLLCRECHRFVTENPLAGHAEGLVVWSWEGAA